MSRLSTNASAADRPIARLRFSLSLGERAGVRGNEGSASLVCLIRLGPGAHGAQKVRAGLSSILSPLLRRGERKKKAQFGKFTQRATIWTGSERPGGRRYFGCGAVRLSALVLAGFFSASLQAAESALSTTNLLDKAPAHFAKLDTNAIHYVSLGNGKETLVFVHGWSCNLDFWRFQVPALHEKARLILIDLPGHGKSGKPQVAYTVDWFARAVDAVLRDAKVDRATLLGHSLGTPIICRFYRDHPEKTAALVAVDGALRGFSLTPEQKEGFVGPYRGPQYREAAEKFIDSMFPTAGTEALRDRAKAAMLRTPQHVMASALENMLDKAAWEPSKIEVPLLVLNAKSRFWTEDYEAHVRKIAPKVEYHVMDGVGHFLMQEKPAEFNAILLESLQKHSLVKQ